MVIIFSFSVLCLVIVCNHAEALVPLWNLIPVVLKTSSGGDQNSERNLVLYLFTTNLVGMIRKAFHLCGISC
jgi:hypothetical protein